jgi:parallel beta-helix repeat protein
MTNRSRLISWGILGAALVSGAVLAVVLLWLAPRARVPEGAVLVPRDAASVQEALTLISSGGTIVIEATGEPIYGPIVIDAENITLLSLGGRARLQSAGGDPTLSIQADGVVIKGFDIVSESIGIQLNASDCSIEDVHIASAAIAVQLHRAARCVLRSIETRGGKTGVELVASSSTTVENLTVSDVSEVGVRLVGSWNNSLSHLHLSGNAVGLSIEQGSSNNTVESSRVERSAIAGIEVRSSNSNVCREISLEAVRVGVLLEGVTGVQVQRCVIDSPTVSGVFLQQAVQNSISETQVRRSQGTGIQLTQSAENALIYNSISDCREDGIVLISSNKNLLLGNALSGCAVAIQVGRSDDNRVLRNVISDSSSSGLMVQSGNANRLLDNAVSGGDYGIVLSASRANILLRNAVREADEAGFVLAGTSGENHVSESESRDCTTGFLLTGTAGDLVTQNCMVSNAVGVLLVDLGAGTRIEGNTISENRVGLKQVPYSEGPASELSARGIVVPQSARGAVPILTNNAFRDNRDFDILNESDIRLLAAGNWWGEGRSRDARGAIVSDGVSLDQSAWKGTIAVGTGADTVRVLLGRILQSALAREGFRVIDLIGMNASERVRQALFDADVDLIWWSGAESAGVVLPGTDVPAMVLPSAAEEGWRVIVSARLASELETPTISSLSAWCARTGERVRYAVSSALEDGLLNAFLKAYELDGSVHSMTKSDGLEKVEALLKFGTVDVAMVGSLEETLTLSGFMALDDDREVLRQEALSMIVQPSIHTSHGDIGDILRALAERLTSDVLHNLVSRIRLLGMDPEDVARGFFQ